MGIWEAGPTAFVYSPASRVTEDHRLPEIVILPKQVPLSRPTLSYLGTSADQLKVGSTAVRFPAS